MYTAKVAVGHVASFDPGASQMKISVAIELYGSYDPVETPKPLWGSPGAELSTWTTFQFCCETAIHGHALRHGPPELYSYTALYIIQLYIALHYTTLQHPPLRAWHTASCAARFISFMHSKAHAGDGCCAQPYIKLQINYKRKNTLNAPQTN